MITVIFILNIPFFIIRNIIALIALILEYVFYILFLLFEALSNICKSISNWFENTFNGKFYVSDYNKAKEERKYLIRYCLNGWYIFPRTIFFTCIRKKETYGTKEKVEEYYRKFKTQKRNLLALDILPVKLLLYKYRKTL